MSVTSSDDAGDGVELVQRVVERTAVMAAPGMLETARGAASCRWCGRSRARGADGETLAVVVFVADGFDGGALNDEHECAFDAWWAS
jgi:hypothetical protein